MLLSSKADGKVLVWTPCNKLATMNQSPQSLVIAVLTNGAINSFDSKKSLDTAMLRAKNQINPQPIAIKDNMTGRVGFLFLVPLSRHLHDISCPETFKVDDIDCAAVTSAFEKEMTTSSAIEVGSLAAAEAQIDMEVNKSMATAVGVSLA